MKTDKELKKDVRDALINFMRSLDLKEDMKYAVLDDEFYAEILMKRAVK